MRQFVDRKANAVTAPPTASRSKLLDDKADRKAIAEQARFSNTAAFGDSRYDFDRAHETSRLNNPAWNMTSTDDPGHDRYHSELSESVTTRSEAWPKASRPIDNADVIIVSDESHKNGESESEAEDDAQHLYKPEKNVKADQVGIPNNEFIREFYNHEESQEAQRKLILLREERAHQHASYPSTTTGPSTSPSDAVAKPNGNKLTLPSTVPVTVPDSYKHNYMRKSALNYQKHHAARSGLAQQRSTAHVSPQTPQQPLGVPETRLTSPSPDHPVTGRDINAVPATQEDPVAVNHSCQAFAPIKLASRPAKANVNSASFDTNQATLDYDEAALRAKSYNDLRHEDFHLDPSATENPTPDPCAFNEDLLTRVYKDSDLSIQQKVCRQIPAAEWGKVDRWFAAEMGRIAQRRTKKREERRDIAVRFEKEVGARFDAVSEEIAGMDGKMKQLRKTGGAMLSDRGPKRKR